MNLLDLSGNLQVYLAIGACLFGIGIYGVLHRRNIIGMLISAELLLAGASLNLLAFEHFLGPARASGQVFTLFIMGIAAAEASLALSIVVAVYRNYRSIDTKDSSEMKG